MKKGYFLFSSFIFLILISSCTNRKSKIDTVVVSQELEQEIEMDSIIIPFTLKKNAIYIMGEIGGAVYDFVLDNNAPITEIREDIFCAVYDTAQLVRFKFPTIKHDYYVHPVSIQLASYDFKIDTISVVSNPFRDRAGLIGTEFFLNSVIEIDFQNSVVIRRNILPKNVKNEYFCLELFAPNMEIFFDKAYSMEHRFRYTEISCFSSPNNEKVSGIFMADLGAESTSLMNPFYKKIDIELSKKDTHALPYVFLSEPIMIHGVNMYFYNITENKKMEKPEELDDYTKNRFQDGHIGMNFFKQFNVIFDYPNNKLYLKKYE